MSSWPRLVPPPDLLSRVEGVEPSLQQGRVLGKLGWGAFLFSAASALVAAYRSNAWSSLVQLNWGEIEDRWLLIVAVGSLVVAFVFFNWTRIWVDASKKPFRYTYSIEDFQPVQGGASEQCLAWLRHDLATRLSQRVGRLSLLDERFSPTTTFPESHIHIGGSYGVRRRSDGVCAIEVMAWVRLGPTGSPATLAHPVKFTLKRGEDELSTQEGAGSYEKLVERVYFSVATHIYAQIRTDVQHKINLLPRRYFRAAAYFYEAEDYLRSNTLDAYDQARELYAEVIRLYNPGWGESASAHSIAGRVLQGIDRLLAAWSLAWRRSAAHVWPGLGRIEVMLARAELGYARTLVYRRSLARFSGQRMNPIFEARPVAQRAVRRLRRLSADVPGRRKRLFDALVTEAAALAALGSQGDGSQRLKEARRLDPARAEQNAAYLYTQGQVETRQRGHHFQRAVELVPFFEVAQLERAIETEMVWRRRPTLEENVAEIVAGEYHRVLSLNPGNITAWANLGYMYWLLERPSDAREALERGREYKEIKRETFVAELDYSLARIAAEAGDFKRAYRHYIDAVTAQLAQGISHDRGYTGYQFETLTRTVLGRFKAYKCRVRRHWREAAQGRGPAVKGTTPRVRAAVYAFVLNDYGEACLNYWLRSGEDRYLKVARSAFESALYELRTKSQHRTRPQTRYPVIHSNLNRLQLWEVDWVDVSELDEDAAIDAAQSWLQISPGDTNIDRALTYEPGWSDGLLEKTWTDMAFARQWRSLATRLADYLEDRVARARVLERDAPFAPSSSASELDERYLAQIATGSSTTAIPGELALSFQQRRAGRAAHMAKARELKKLMEELLSAAKEFDAEAQSVLERLLPHDWLWTTRRTLRTVLTRGGLRRFIRGQPEFAWSAARRRKLKRERRWERELDDLHAKALFALCVGELNRLEDRARARQSQRESGSTRNRVRRFFDLVHQRTANALDARRFQPIGAVLDLLRRRFWPDDIDILRACRALPDQGEGQESEYDRRIRELIRRWCERDPAFWALSWVDTTNFPIANVPIAKEAIELLNSMRGDRGVPPYLYRRIGDELNIRNDTESALAAYELGRETRQPAVLLGIGRAQWKAGRHNLAVDAFGSIERTPRELGPTWRTQLLDQLLSDGDIGDADSYRSLKSWLGRELTTAQGDAARRGNRMSSADVDDAASAVLRVTRDHYQPIVRRPGETDFEAAAVSLLPGVPATLEAHKDFFPEDESTPVVLHLIRSEIPELRQETATQVGLQLPPVLINASSDVAPDSYRLHVDGVPVADGSFDAHEMYFVPDVGGALRGVEGLPGRNPRDGSEGFWFADKPRDLAAWDRYTYMIQHLRAAMLRYPAGLPLAAWITQQLPSAATRVRLVAVLRGLVEEGVPIGDAQSVIASFAEADQRGEVRDIIEDVRFSLRDVLPGADGSRDLLALPPELENRIAALVQTNGGARFLAASISEAAATRDALAELLATVDADRSALVVLTPGLRPFVRWLVALRNPYLPVLAYSELPDDTMPRIQSVDSLAASA